MSITAIDRFLYRATADTVAERIADAYMQLEIAFDDLAAVRDPGWNKKPTKAELLEGVDDLLACRGALFEALDAAEHHVADFIERNRP